MTHSFKEKKRRFSLKRLRSNERVYAFLSIFLYTDFIVLLCLIDFLAFSEEVFRIFNVLEAVSLFGGILCSAVAHWKGMNKDILCDATEDPEEEENILERIRRMLDEKLQSK